MGNAFVLPKDHRSFPETQGNRGRQVGHGYQENNLQGTRPVILPFNSFTIKPEGVEETEVKTVPPPSSTYSPPNSSRLEVETTKMHSSASSLAETSSQHPSVHYIKRYRNEEEKLLDMLHEREALLRAAMKQGQQLRAKCNRYKDELESVKSMSVTEMTDQQWKKKYYEVDKKYRDIKEQLDVMMARNKNGRDFLDQQKETISLLSLELHREQLQKQKLMSNSLSSLHSVGVTDKKGKMVINQLRIDNKFLEERVNDLLTRNHRGREYLSKLEAESRDQKALISSLKKQLTQEKAENKRLLEKLGALTGSVHAQGGKGSVSRSSSDENQMALYAQVHKNNGRRENGNRDTPSRIHNSGFEFQRNASMEEDLHETRSAGFELDDERGHLQREEAFRFSTSAYEEMDFPNSRAKGGTAKDTADDTEEEYRIETTLEPEIDEVKSDFMKTKTEQSSAMFDKGDEMDGEYNTVMEPYEPKSVFEDELITRF